MKINFSLRKNDQKDKVQDIALQLNRIRAESSFLVITPETTGYSWMGVNRATLAMFPKQTVSLPQYFSNSLLNKKQTDQLQNLIKELHFDQIIFSGFPPYFSAWIKCLKEKSNQIGVIYHGFFSELAGNQIQMDLLAEIISLHKQKIIDKIAFNKKGMGESLGRLWNITSHKIIVKTPIFSKPQQFESGFNIGVLGNDQFRKNLHNQVVAASMVSSSIIHTTSNCEFSYLPSNSIVYHPSGQEHAEFIQLLGRMQLNLHLSYSESWGQITTESLAMGVPCLVSYHSDVFDYNEELRDKLVINDYDNSFAIYEKIMLVKMDPTLPKKCQEYIYDLNKESEKTIFEFLKA